jgi:hypothetical protein
MDEELVRKAAIRHYLATIGMVAESARLLEELGIGTDEAIDQAIAAMPLDRVYALLMSFKRARIDLESTVDAIEAYQLAGKPYGDTYGGMTKWKEEQAGEGREMERSAEKAAEHEADKATDEAEDRAADEGMYDREEELMLRAAEDRLNVDPGDKDE